MFFVYNCVKNKIWVIRILSVVLITNFIRLWLSQPDRLKNIDYFAKELLGQVFPCVEQWHKPQIERL